MHILKIPFRAKLFTTMSILTALFLRPCVLSAEKNTETPAVKKGILLVAFGTTHEKSLKAYKNIERLVKEKFKNIPVRWAYTSSIIKKKLARQGKHIPNVTEALSEMKKEGFTHIAVQSLLISSGEEQLELLRDTEPFKKGSDTFTAVAEGSPMLVTSGDLEAFVTALVANLPKERKPEDAIILMGHGNSKGLSDMTYIAAAYKLNEKDKNIFMGTVEGVPDLASIRGRVRKAGIKKAYLLPMMVVAGDHAVNDLAGNDAESWKSVLQKDGIECVPVLKGLGEYDCVAEIFTEHLASTLNKLEKNAADGK